MECGLLRSYKNYFLLKIILDFMLKVVYNKITVKHKTLNTKGKIPMLNKFLVSGRLTADPEMQTIGENRLCKFSIACDRPKRKGEEKAEVDFFSCTAWNRNADVVVDWFGKGDMITLVGAVHINRYEKDGQKRTATEIKVEEIHFSGGKKKDSNPYISTENDPLF